MKFHRTYHPASWSKQAREFADRIFEHYKVAMLEPEEFHEFNFGNGVYKTLSSHSHEYWMWYFQMSYRHPIITTRAAKRFGRLVREYERKNAAQAAQ